MAELPIIFPDVSAAVGTLLRANTTAHVGSRPPKSTSLTGAFSPFVQITRTGGTARDVVVDDAQITIDCWAPKGHESHDLAQLCRAHLNAAKGDTVAGVQLYQIIELSGPGQLTDPTSRVVFYRQSFIIGARGAV